MRAREARRAEKYIIVVSVSVWCASNIVCLLLFQDLSLVDSTRGCDEVA